MSVQFGVLGAVEAYRDGRLVDLGPARQRYVLAALLIDANGIVPSDQLVVRVWGEDAPPRALPTLRSYLSRLRSILSVTGDCEIQRRSGGYVLQVDEDTVDLHRFRQLVADSHAADDAAAIALLTQALGLWRGAAIGGLDTHWAARIREGLHAEKLAAELEHYDVRLRRGEHVGVLVELAARAEEHPLDERLAGQLLLALYRSGRQAEALQHYEQIRLRLADELGADPSPALQHLHQQMLTAAPALVSAGKARVSTVPVPRQLPAPPPVFTGRADELAVLDAALDSHSGAGRPISTIGGPGGIGKTSLALHWSHRALDRFPDGQLYANLHGFDNSAEPVPPAVVIRGFLDALGVDPHAIPQGLDAQAALYRSLVADRRVLVLLDNARDTDQVAPLLPGGATCTVLVTSRQQLTGLIAVHGARPLTLDVLPDPDALELLAGHVGRSRLTREPDAADDVLRSCAGLPLALSIVAARTSIRPTFPLASVADELRDTAGRLDALDAGDARTDLRTVFSWSYQELSIDAARLFRLLGVHPGPDIALPAAASLAGVAPARVRPLLAELTGASMLTEHRPGRFLLHDLIRVYASEQSRRHDPDAERHGAVRRVLDHYLHSGCTASRLLSPTRVPITVAPPAPGVTPEDLADLSQAAAWFGAERAMMQAAVRHAAASGLDAHSWQLAWTIAEFLDQNAHWHDYAATQHTALTAARRLGTREGQALAHRCLARACTRLGAYADAHSHLGNALDLHRELGDENGQAIVHMGFGRLLESQGDHSEAIAHVQRALELFQACGNLSGQVNALNGIGWCHARSRNYRGALTSGTEALRLALGIEGCPVAAIWDTLGYAHHRLGDHAQAIDCHQHALACAQQQRDFNAETEALDHLSEVYVDIGDVAAARESWQRALAIHQMNGHPGDAEAIRKKLRDLVPADRD